MKKYIVCIGSGIYQIGLLKKIKKLNYCSISVDQEKYAPGFKFSDRKIVLSTNKIKEVIQELKKNKLNKKIIAVMTQSGTFSAITVSSIATNLQLRTLNLKVANFLVKKEKLCNKFNHGIKRKKYKFSEINKINIPYPYVCKFSSLSGGQGMKKIKSKKDLIKIKNFSFKDKYFYVEQFITGDYLSVLGVKNGNKIKLYSILKKKINDNFSNNEIVFKPDHYHKYKNEVFDYCKKILKKTNFNFGSFQIELIVSSNGSIFISEIEPSLVGSYITDIMIPRITNSDFIEDAIKLYTGKKINYKNKINKRYALLKYFYNKKKLKVISRLVKKYANSNNIRIIIKKNFEIINKRGLAKYVIYLDSQSKTKFELIKKKLSQ